MNSLDAEKKAAVKEMLIKTAKIIFRLPIALTNIESGDTEDIKCVLVVTIPEKDKATGKVYYNFQTDVVGKAKVFSDYAKAFFLSDFGGDYKLKVTKYSTKVYKPELCYGTMPGRPACKFSATACKYAHSLNEVQCSKCGMIGSHASSKCKPRKSQ